MSPQKRAAIAARVQRLAWSLDSRFAVPLTRGRLRIGLDALIGLVPVIGDGAMAILALYIVWQARRMGTPWRTIFKMLLLVAIDVAIGFIPVVGDVADALFKVNVLNLKLMGLVPKPDSRPTPPTSPRQV